MTTGWHALDGNGGGNRGRPAYWLQGLDPGPYHRLTGIPPSNPETCSLWVVSRAERLTLIAGPLGGMAGYIRRLLRDDPELVSINHDVDPAIVPVIIIGIAVLGASFQ